MGIRASPCGATQTPGGTVIALLWLACAGPAPSGDDTEAPDSPVAPPTPPEPPAYSGGTCPALVDGRNEAFPSGGEEREFLLYLPENPEGAPVVFAWHWLGGSAASIVNTMDLRPELVDAGGAVVIAPESCCGSFEWGFTPTDDPTPDLTLFDDLLRCVWEQHNIDLDRVYTTGMSAGGLWSSFLLQRRAEHLAAAAPLSGGIGDVTEGNPIMEYQPPARPLPVLLTWGGTSDMYGPYSFHNGSLELSAELRALGSWVGECQHDGGHTIPDGATQYVWRFLQDHRWSDTAAPYAAGFPEGVFPEWCTLPGGE